MILNKNYFLSSIDILNFIYNEIDEKYTFLCLSGLYYSKDISSLKWAFKDHCNIHKVMYFGCIRYMQQNKFQFILIEDIIYSVILIIKI